MRIGRHQGRRSTRRERFGRHKAKRPSAIADLKVKWSYDEGPQLHPQFPAYECVARLVKSGLKQEGAEQKEPYHRSVHHGQVLAHSPPNPQVLTAKVARHGKEYR